MSSPQSQRLPVSGWVTFGMLFDLSKPKIPPSLKMELAISPPLPACCEVKTKQHVGKHVLRGSCQNAACIEAAYKQTGF